MPLLGFAVSPPSLPMSVGDSQAKTQSSVYEGCPPKIQLTPTCKHPIVRLDLDVITDEVAARLATSLLGHLLFLKSQVPFPITQLFRIPSAKSSARGTKQRADLLQSFDTLTSHLITTFTSLSTALARCSSKRDNPESDVKQLSGLPRDTERVFLAILVGPSTGSARAKVVFGVDGLETKVWGMRDDVKAPRDVDDTDSEDEGDEGEDEDEDEDEDDEGSEGYEDQSEDADSDSHDEMHSNSGSPPPHSRSPTPDSDSEPSPPPPYTTHAEQQHVLHRAERLLARTLATADAEGNSMAAEMAPTHTHILLRAPRRFQHPAWIPKQNITSSMESTLDVFLAESGLSARDTALRRPKHGTQKGKVEGVWITCRDGFGEANGHGDEWKVGDDENDEMIWWSWDGKLTGFSEW